MTSAHQLSLPYGREEQSGDIFAVILLGCVSICFSLDALCFFSNCFFVAKECPSYTYPSTSVYKNKGYGIAGAGEKKRKLQVFFHIHVDISNLVQ